MPAAKKTCYYELLGLERKCDEKEIKTAYRKLALKMHPDKAALNNLTVEEATEKFQFIQEAYSTLSDPQERAWYDAHREQILRGEDGTSEDPFKTKINLYKYFGSGCYDGFKDNEGGFYQVYSDLFQAIDQEEQDWEECDEDHVAMPVFGDSKSDWNDVGAFYRRWLDFCSRKAFGHADKWNPKDAPNRPTRRAMEAENTKARKAAKKEFNNEVRQIVQVVQRRDPRVIEHTKQKAKEEAEKAQREAAEKEAKATREAKERKQRKLEAQRAEEERWRELEEEREARRARGEVVSEDEDSSEEQLGFNCEPCRKFFKSEKAFEQHTKSKKHLEIVKKLRRQLDEEIARKQEGPDSDEEDDEEDEEDDEEDEAPAAFPSAHELNGMKVSELRKNASELGADDDEIEQADDAENAKAAFIELIMSFKAVDPSSSSTAVPKADDADKRLRKDSEDAASSQGDGGSDEEDAFLARFAANREQRGKGEASNFAPPPRDGGGSSGSDAGAKDGSEDEAPASPSVLLNGSKKAQKRQKQKEILLEKQKEKEKVQELVESVRKAQKDGGEVDEQDPGEKAEEVPEVTQTCLPCQPQGKSRRAKGGAAAKPSDEEPRCQVCGEEFPSRSTLFKHIRDSGHAALKEVDPAEEPSGGKKGRRKK